MMFGIQFRGDSPRFFNAIAALLVLVPLLAFLSTPAASAQDTTDEVVVFVMDLSGSMNEPFDNGQTKLDAAKDAFVEAFANVSAEAQVGLRTYGDQIEPTSPEQREPGCTNDTRLASPVTQLQRNELIGQVQDFTALGDTPIGLALNAAANDVPAGATGTIVLFSDGRDECFDADLDGDPNQGPSYGENPCDIATSITNGSQVDRIVTVGFRADPAAEAELRCIAESTGGTFTSIETPEDARDVLPELLVNLSAPREAQRLTGREISGGTSSATAPDLVRLNEVGTDAVLYTDSIDMNSRRVYLLDDYGPEGGTFTATVFGLPPEPNIKLDMWIFVNDLDQQFFKEQNADTDAGLPARPTASIRCTDCLLSNGPWDAIFVVELTSRDTSLEGNYELEFLTEGPAFGGSPTTCSAPQECFYPAEIEARQAELAELQEGLASEVGERASSELLAERDQLRDQFNEDQAAISVANDRAALIEERIASAPAQGNSWRLPLLMILGGLILAFAPLGKLISRSSDDEDEDVSAEAVDPAMAAAQMAAAEPVQLGASGPMVNVGPTPAVSPARAGSGHDWASELEAAKDALAQQRPAREEATPEVIAQNGGPTASPPPPTDPAALQQQALEQAAAQQAATQASAPAPGWYPDPATAGQFRWWDGGAWTEHTETQA